MTRFDNWLFAALTGALVALSLTACGGGDDDQEPTAIDVPERQSVVIGSETACVSDEDCRAGLFCFQRRCAHQCADDEDCDGGQCTDRGRCATGSTATLEDLDIPDTLIGVQIDEYPDPFVTVDEDDTSITFEFGVDGDLPAQGVPYRLERSDGHGDDQRVLHARGEGDRFSITVDAGNAHPNADEPDDVDLTIHSALGTISLGLEPQRSLEGLWEGQLAISDFGGQSFPIELYVAGDDADDLAIALPVQPSSLFSPHAQFDEPDVPFAELTYRENLDVYQMVYTAGFDLGDGVFGGVDGDQVQRTFRLDFDADALEDGQLHADVVDRWDGAYTHQDSDGDLDVGEIRYSGEVTLARVDDLPDHVNPSDRNLDGLPAAEPSIIDDATVDHCSTDMDAFSAETITTTVDGQDESFGCDDIASVNDFIAADVHDRAGCALAVTAGVFEEETTSDQINSYFAGDGGPDMSFEEFLQSCADDDDDVCQPNERAVCAHELLADAARDVQATHFGDDFDYTDALRAQLMEAFIDMSQESFLARQLGAFYADMDLRRDWLQQGSAPEAFVAAIEDSNEQLMDDWKASVLEVYSELFTSFFTPSAVTFMGQPTTNSDVNDRRRGLLQEATSMWRSYADALQLAANRWNEVVHDEQLRAEHVDYLQSRATELYVTMGILMQFNRAAGIDAQSSLLAGDFASLVDAIGDLDQSFDDALFARDAEVVTARSLDPLTDNDSLLQQRQQDAQQVVGQSLNSIDEILDEVTIEALQEEDMRNQLENERREAANEIAGICGLPPGCDVDSLISDPDNCLRVEPGDCGLNEPGDVDQDIAFDPAQVAASEAGSAVLDVLEAFEEVTIQKDETDGHLQKLELEYEELRAFQRDIEQWNSMRMNFVSQLESNIDQRDEYRDERIEDMVSNIEQRAATRLQGIEEMDNRIAEWNQMSIDGAQSSYRDNIDNLVTRQGGQWAEFTGDSIGAGLEAVGRGLPKSNGTSNDYTSTARASFWLMGQASSLAGQATRMGTEHAVEHQEAAQERDAAIGAAERQSMEEQADLADRVRESEINELRDEMAVSDQLTDDDIDRLQDQIELMEANLEAELAYERDMAEFRRKHSEHHQNHVDTSGRQLRLDQSRFNVLQRTADYDRLVQNAKLEAARFHEINDQLTNLDDLVGGVSAIFSQSHKLERTERYLNRSRQALMDWLVLLEYYAVRPFIEERVQIMLARNAYQLEEIAERLNHLQNNCGGSERSSATDTISLREDVLGLTGSTADDVTGEEIEPEERFRRWLENAHVPIDRRIRWSTSSSLEDALSRNEGVFATAFPVRLDQFSNLPLACNAKIESVALQVVGDVGDSRPTASLLYEGTSQIRSCQPNIEDYVDAFGQGRTSYGEVTQMRAQGRSMSPTAGINEFPDRDTDVNRTLAGLPIASEYTLLIDSELGSNSDVDWSNMEDIKIEFAYNYQDLFPEACEDL